MHPTPESPAAQPIVTATGITKSFGGVAVLQDVSFDLAPGEVHTLMGENGAGKSTLMKILGGIHQPDAGAIIVDGKRVTISSPHAAQKLGIALIHQEPLNFPDLEVAENIAIGSGTTRGSFGTVNWGAMYDDAERILSSLGVDLDPRAKVRGLSIADQQMVELAAALSQKTRVLLMDEPTAALTPGEVANLFRIVRQLKQAGTAIVFISHRLEEVFEISDRITVLRDGKFVETVWATDTTRQQIISMMVGRELGALYERPAAQIGEPLLRVENLSSDGRFADVSFDVRRGEIVGLAGLVGAGRTDVAQSIFGIHPRSAGRIWIDEKLAHIATPRDAIDLGIGYVPEDRARHGLLLPFGVAPNTAMADISKISRAGFLSPRRERSITERWRDALRIRLRDVRQPARELSGGNQQKVVLAKWLLTEPRVLILDEPTRGIDVGAKAEVHHLMGELARQGKSILMISSDLPEVLAISDRVLVMREGRLTGEFSRAEATQQRIMSAATGEDGKPLERVRGRRDTSRAARWLRFRELGIAVFVLLTVLLAWWKNPVFMSTENLRNILLSIPLTVVVAMGMMMVIISRNIDLSVGSTLGFAAIVVGNVFISWPEMPIPLAAAIAMGIGAGLGFVNGALVTWLRVPSIIATLGTLSAYRGLVFIYSGARQVDPNDIPFSLIRLSQGSPVGVPWIVLFAVFVAVATWLFMRYTRIGREIYAVGSNTTAAQLRGIAVKRTLLIVFTITGALAGLAGVMYASRFGYVNPRDTGSGFELDVITAVIIGGTSVFGGSGAVLGTLLGCLLLGVVTVALPILGVSGSSQLAVYGFAILLAASIDTLIQRRLGRDTSGGGGGA